MVTNAKLNDFTFKDKSEEIWIDAYHRMLWKKYSLIPAQTVESMTRKGNFFIISNKTYLSKYLSNIYIGMPRYAEYLVSFKHNPKYEFNNITEEECIEKFLKIMGSYGIDVVFYIKWPQHWIRITDGSISRNIKNEQNK